MRTDRELLSAYISSRDEDAFGELVSRHMNMVYRACLRRLKNAEDARDACQAVFVVLARKARAAKKQTSLAAWLHAVARHVSLTAIRTKAKRAKREGEAALLRASSGGGNQLGEDLDEALHRLPAAQRQAVILRYLEGHSQEDAATLAGCPVGTLSRRASDGLVKLRQRLGKRGTVLGATALVALLECEARAAIPQALLPSILTASKAATTGAAAGAVGIGTNVMILAEGAMKAMLWTKVKLFCAAAAAVILAGGLAVPLASAGGKGKPPEKKKVKPPEKKKVKTVIPTPAAKPLKMTERFRKMSAARWGGSPATVAAADRALVWLAANQEEDGHWDSVKHGARVRDDVAATSAALLALVGASHSGQYRLNLRSAANWLVKQQKKDGSFGPQVPSYEAALALTAAYRLTADPVLKKPTQRALSGWLKREVKRPSESTVVLLALLGTAAKAAGLPQGGELLGAGRRNMDLLWKNYKGASPDGELTAAVLLRHRIPEKWQPHIRGWFRKVSTNLAKERSGVLEWIMAVAVLDVSGEPWKAWNKDMKKRLIESQQVGDGKNVGSWPAPQGNDRVRTTAYLCLTVSIYYSTWKVFDWSHLSDRGEAARLYPKMGAVPPGSSVKKPLPATLEVF